MKFLKFRPEKHGVTQSLLNSFNKCKVLCYYKIRGVSAKRKKRDALDFGSLFHETVAVLYRRSKAPSKKRVRKTVRLVAKQLEIKDEKLIDMCKMLAVEYFLHWKGDFTKTDKRTTELEFSVKLKDLNCPIRGKVDAWFRIRKEEWMLETKTASRINWQELLELLGFKLQHLLYLWARWRLKRVAPFGVLYNVVRKPGLRRSDDETYADFLKRCREHIRKKPDHYFIRREIRIRKSELKAFEVELVKMVREFLRWHERGTKGTYRSSVACAGRFGMCEFAKLCATGSFEGYRVRDRFHQELDSEVTK